jgi:hypothetical protein
MNSFFHDNSPLTKGRIEILSLLRVIGVKFEAHSLGDLFGCILDHFLVKSFENIDFLCLIILGEVSKSAIFYFMLNVNGMFTSSC